MREKKAKKQSPFPSKKSLTLAVQPPIEDMDIQYSSDVLCQNKNPPSKIYHADIHAVDMPNYNSDSEISVKKKFL